MATIREFSCPDVCWHVTSNTCRQDPTKEEKPETTLPTDQTTRTATHRSSSEEDGQEKPEKESEAVRNPDDLTIHRPVSRTTVRDQERGVERVLSRSSTRYSVERFEQEQALAMNKTKSLPIAPTTTTDGNILVTWYTTDDPENPQNWSQTKKAMVLLQLGYANSPTI